MRRSIFITMLAVAGLVAITGAPAFSQPAGAIFEITGSGKLTHFEAVVAGAKPPVTSVDAAAIIACIQGTAAGCTSSTIETNAGGKAYLILDGLTAARLGTNTSCTGTTDLEGVVGGDGSFMFSGKHNKSETNFIVQGKVTFDKTQFPLLVPLAIKKATIMAVSEDQLHYGIGRFKTVVFVGICP